MDTNRLKKFAVDARNKIKAGVEAKLSTLGFDSQGNVPDFMKPQLMQGGSLWNGQLMTESFYHQWMALYDAVKKHGVHHIYEEAAYTWFNRLVAIRILQKNGIIEPVLTYVDEARTPKIVDDARSAGRIPPMTEADRQRLMELLDDDTKVTEQFAILISAYCHANLIIRQSFGRMADYTELLLPNNILAENGFIDDLNHTEFITDEDYKSSELIGWLYQFYISERKDEVFAKKGKYDADEIAPATQIFTPHWIVEYMVQNTIGRIYLDNHPVDADILKPKWKYLVDQEPTNEARADVQARLDSALQGGGSQRQQRDDEHIYHFDELTELRCADLGCGSGHILGYMFDILFDLYIYEGYTRKEAVENILSHNITGVDIDLRAKQLATFALLLKACQKDESFRDGNVLPHVLTMPEPIADSDRHQLFHEFFKGEETNNILTELDDAFDLLKDAQTLGSIMKFNLSKSTLLAIRQTLDYWKEQSVVPDSVTKLLPSFRLILTLTQKYTALVMNPPYMGSGKFNNVLSKYVKDNYPKGKADLATVFVQLMPQHLVDNGKYAFIIPPSWMFLSAFEGLRKEIIKNNTIDSLLHLSRGVFGADFGSSSAVISNTKPTNNTTGIYFRLIERTFQEFDQKHLRMLFEKTLENHDFKYKFSDYSKDVTEIVYSADGAKVYYPNVKQKDFEKIPGCPIGYWISSRMLSTFDKHRIGEQFDVKTGLSLGKKTKYVRFWFELQFGKIKFNSNSQVDFYSYKWFPITSGLYRKWYGYLWECVNWKNNGAEVYAEHGSTVRNSEFYLREGISWPDVSSGNLCARYYPCGFIIADIASMVYKKGIDDLWSVLGFMNTKIALKLSKVLNPTIHFKPGNVSSLPYTNIKEKSKIEQNILISKLDWDAHETSWDFKENPLVTIMKAAEGSSVGVLADEAPNNDCDAGRVASYAITQQQRKSNGRQPIVERPSANRTTAVSQTSDGRQPSSLQHDDDTITSLSERYEAAMTSLEELCQGSSDDVVMHGCTLEACVRAFEALWERRFMQLHANEEELNRQFINIYGLQDELIPDVPLSEITILQQGEISIE